MKCSNEKTRIQWIEDRIKFLLSINPNTNKTDMSNIVCSEMRTEFKLFEPVIHSIVDQQGYHDRCNLYHSIRVSYFIVAWERVKKEDTK